MILSLAVAPEPTKSGNDKIHTQMEFPQFQTASTIIEKVRAPAVKVPPPVLKDDGNINREYFSVLAAKAGPFVSNSPSHFEHDYPGEKPRISVQHDAMMSVSGASSLIDTVFIHSTQ